MPAGANLSSPLGQAGPSSPIGQEGKKIPLPQGDLQHPTNWLLIQQQTGCSSEDRAALIFISCLPVLSDLVLTLENGTQEEDLFSRHIWILFQSGEIVHYHASHFY